MNEVVFCYDLEFYEGPVVTSTTLRTIEPVSIGMVDEFGNTYYALVQDADDTIANQWCRENLLPMILKERREHPELVKTREQIRKEVLQFVGDADPVFYGYYSSYDHVSLCWLLFGDMSNLPRNWPMYTRDIKQYCDYLEEKALELGRIHWLHWDEKENKYRLKLPEQTSIEHNALNDALHNRKMYEHLLFIEDMLV